MALNRAFSTHKKKGVQISSKKMKSLCKRQVSIWNPDTSKEIVRLYTKCIQFLPQPSQLSYTCYVDEMMIPCQLSTFSEFICSAFQFQGHLAQKISKCMKNNKWSEKGLKNDDVAFNGAFWTHKKLGAQISFEKRNPFVTDEFPDEILILWKRLSVLYTKCIQFLS